MVHKVEPKKESWVEKLKEEQRLDAEVMNRWFQKLPTPVQSYIMLASRSSLGAEKIFPFKEKGQEYAEKTGRRYGVWTVHDKKLYVGYVKPVGDKAEVMVNEVYP